MNINDIKWSDEGLIPVIIQDSISFNVLMLGYMNNDSLKQTLISKEVTFFSRSKQRLWVKGETSGNKLLIESLELDCDKDTLLIKAKPIGPTCHLENYSCFKSENKNLYSIITELELIIDQRKNENSKTSYVASILKKGVKEIAKKVIEEAGETSIAAVTNDGRLIDESADLLFHLLVLLKNQNYSLNDVLIELKTRSSN
ncbi:bifunctional phosphoribosyl-AMP cyclohydrolase/phosphoribosyl-ATP diphosphatase HisIE [Gammaproteobacteria bacterium]|jgi:phosphoribosyl-ATP pyrophosphohydrolase/phosphoribosyl-AMP cyclohydrolase|nr:bifunctional phosphoribosyl-AMP cyclohydrolase/phosphoribosyl-ATP diphosphatase HisIE [Gammaproteobacteria bacterium]MDA9805335.1 bifunctional phosphoribosyl-AMP cyclohydrolase/phosphoribosyl-ATP diphosphatase HisIE [Gammaproteobacteria bacterium]MDC3375951.1 bifunctional phosphoribosyl-AMP cyclohydrolase/phosphoribosyl-ATP diphosphatase HisIE [Gammaproteobacteria bacterium]